MSMLSAQCNELRFMAESVGLAMPQAATLMMGAAGSIEGLDAENAKLRELCRKFAEYVSQDRCEGCVCKHRCNDGEIDECWQLTEIRKAAYDLGIEVDG